MIKIRYITFLSLLILCSCSPRISLYDQYAYTQVTSIKIDALMVMQEASESYTSHISDIKKVDISIRKIIEYEKHRPTNSISTQMWEKLNDPGVPLYAGFITRWKQKGKLDTAFVSSQQRIIGLAFDQIAELESGKINPSKR